MWAMALSICSLAGGLNSMRLFFLLLEISELLMR